MDKKITNLDDLIFQDKNKAYGAYANRRNYSRYMFWALFTGVAIFLTGAAIPLIANYMDDSGNKDGGGTIFIQDTLLNAPKKAEKIILPDKPKAQVLPQRYFAPQIVDDTLLVTDFIVDMDNVKNKRVDDTSNIGFVIDTTTKREIIEITKPETFVWVEEMPEFPGGDEGRARYLAANIVYPPAAIDANISGVVYVTFVVNEEGKVVDVDVLRGIGGGCDEEALRVISSMPPWKPGRQNGRAVRVLHNIPISFVLR